MKLILNVFGPMTLPPLKLGIKYGEGAGDYEMEDLKNENGKTIRVKPESLPDNRDRLAQYVRECMGGSAKGTLVEKRYKDRQHRILFEFAC